MRRVILESPFSGTPEIIERNLRYLRACLAGALRRGEAPFASHALYTQPGVLRDEVPDERELGIEAGLVWGAVAEATVVCLDLGMSSGMERGIRRAVREGRPVELRLMTFVELAAAVGGRTAYALSSARVPEVARATARLVLEDEQRKAVA